jgi:putative redox protein
MTMTDSTSPKPRISGAIPARPSMGNPIARSHATWKGDLRFEAGVGDRVHNIDGNSKNAPSPVETLLGSVGTCAASDVVEILNKQRTPPVSLMVDVMAVRRAEFPRRVMQLEVMFTIGGETLERAQVERAIALSIEKYCTVAASLAGDIALTTVLVLNGAPGEPVKQPMFSASFPSADSR